MSVAEIQTDEQTFEQRRFEQLRQETAGDIGKIALRGYEQRRYDEITSGLAEALSGTIDNSYPFRLENGRLVAEDGEPFEDLLIRGLHEDMKLASRDPFFSFLPQRSRAELDNFRRMEAMARGETTYNTILEISPCTEELDTSEPNRNKLIKASQKPYWRRTMVRLSHWDGDKLHIATLSSDNLKAAENFNFPEEGSSVSLFKEAVRRKLGYEYRADSSGDMLAEPIELELEGHSWKSIAKDVVAEADKILSERHGGIWRQGRPEGEAVDLQRYVESQTQIIEGLFKAERKIANSCSNYESYQTAFNRELFNCIALLERRLESGRTDEKIVDYEAASGSAGAVAQAQGRSYDMCGTIIAAGENNVAQQAGSETLMRLQNKKVKCPECSEEVVVPTGKLKEGKLTCVECGYWLDVCTGKKGFNKESAPGIQIVSGFDVFIASLRKLDHEIRFNRLVKQHSEVPDEPARKRQEKLIANEELEIQRLSLVEKGLRTL